MSMKEKQAKEAIEKAGGSWEVFSEWMNGQTMGMVNGEPDFYDYDVNRFIKYKCSPKNEPPKHWD